MPPPAPPPGPPKNVIIPVNPLPAGTTALGCFKDQGDPTGTNGRDLNGFAQNVPGMTTEMCIQTCTSKGFTFAGTQDSTWCFCGNASGKSGPAQNCNMKCGGNQAETCGGTWANMVYKIK